MRALAALAAALLPHLAAACPSCAGNSRYDATKLVLLGSLVLLPFAIAGVVWRIVKRLDYSDPPPGGPGPTI